MDDLLNWGYELFKRSISFAIPTTSFRTVITGDKSEVRAHGIGCRIELTDVLVEGPQSGPTTI